ncbi:MAG: hypothetical protein JXB34_02380 [Bacteroidales bacterium]|nr:hypothetical protein [Bacteroidales bacterium]
MISLLDDNDHEVLHAVTDELLKQGVTIIPKLEQAWESAIDQRLQERLENVIHNIQYVNTKEKLSRWVKDGAADIIEGASYIAQFQYPGVRVEDISHAIARISDDIYLSTQNHLSAIEKIRLLNYVVFEINNFSRNTANFYSPQNSYINQVIESRKGNPISLGIIYLAVAQKVGLPVYGVNLPKSFVLAYLNEFRQIDSKDKANDILFYINPYNKGTVLTRLEIDNFIVQQNLKPSPEYYEICDNKCIVLRLLTNLMIAYQKLGFDDKIKLLEDIARVLR